MWNPFANAHVPGLKPDIIMMNSIISAAAKIGDFKTAENVFQQALEAGDMTFKIPLVAVTMDPLPSIGPGFSLIYSI